MLFQYFWRGLYFSMEASLTISRFGIGWIPALLLTHVDGQAGLDGPERQRTGLKTMRRPESHSCIPRNQPHLLFMVLKRRIPSARPQIWIRSSLLILRRSAPKTAVKPKSDLILRSCPDLGLDNLRLNPYFSLVSCFSGFSRKYKHNFCLFLNHKP